MKVYCPTQFNWKRGEEVVGWIDEFSGDVYICGASKSIEFYRQFESVGIKRPQVLGSCVGKSSASEASIFALPQGKQQFISLSCNASKVIEVVIFFPLYSEFSCSGDFEGRYSLAPLKFIKWTSIVNLNKDGKFLQFTPVQVLVSQASKAVLNCFPIKQLIHMTSALSLRTASEHSATLRQFLARKDAFAQMYKFLLSSRGSVTEASRLQYRNALVLVLADFIAGALFGILFALFSDQIFSLLGRFMAYFTNGFFEEYLDWFMGWPAGFKFNANLTRFLGRVFLLLLRTWKAIFWFKIPLLVIERIVSVAKYFGFSVIVALAIDFFSIATLHIRFFHRLIKAVYRGYFCCLLSLFRLFQGRKWNTLRHRVDSTTYSMDQLLVGMLLFAILLCTFPTVYAYYLLFVGALVAVKTLQCTADSVLTLFCALPLFSLLQRNSALLSEGIKLQPLRLSTPPTFLLQMEQIPVSKLLASFFDAQKHNWTSKFNQSSLERFITGK